MTRFDAFTLEILWSRLISLVDEMATTLLRTSFSTVIGAANDFGCELLDSRGRGLAHATRSMPVFNQVLPHVTQYLIQKYGDDGIRPGEHTIAVRVEDAHDNQATDKVVVSGNAR